MSCSAAESCCYLSLTDGSESVVSKSLWDVSPGPVWRRRPLQVEPRRRFAIWQKTQTNPSHIIKFTSKECVCCLPTRRSSNSFAHPDPTLVFSSGRPPAALQSSSAKFFLFLNKINNGHFCRGKHFYSDVAQSRNLPVLVGSGSKFMVPVEEQPLVLHGRWGVAGDEVKFMILWRTMKTGRRGPLLQVLMGSTHEDRLCVCVFLFSLGPAKLQQATVTPSHSKTLKNPFFELLPWRQLSLQARHV